MTHEVIFSIGSQLDLIALEDYLADRFFSVNASKFVTRIQEYCLTLGPLPYRGTNHEQHRPGLRSVSFERRVTIFFEVRVDTVLILAVLYRGFMERDPREM